MKYEIASSVSPDGESCMKREKIGDTAHSKYVAKIHSHKGHTQTHIERSPVDPVLWNWKRRI